MQIEDGKGSGHRAQVNQYNRVATMGPTYALVHFASHSSARAFFTYLTDSAYLTMTTTGGYMMVIKNTGQRDLILSRIIGTFGSAAQVKFVKNLTIGTLGNNADAPVNNINLGASQPPDADIQAWNGTGNGMTGYTGGTILSPLFIPAGTVVDLDLKDSVIVTPGTNIGVWGQGVGATALFQLLISFMELDAEGA